MDVVKRQIEALGGNVAVESAPEAGTTISLQVPLTLAIIDGLLVSVADQKYVFPLAGVEECLELPASGDRSGGNDGRIVNNRGELLPVLDVRELFGLAGSAPTRSGTPATTTKAPAAEATAAAPTTTATATAVTGPAASSGASGEEARQIVVVHTGAGKTGFVVDSVLGDFRTVIKNLGQFYRKAEGVSGATILGDGSVALILDAQRLWHLGERAGANAG
jgi:two-component system chemotaxis sensor kinase CheA